MNNTPDYRRRLSPYAEHGSVVSVLFVAGWLAAVAGCQGDPKSPPGNADVEMNEPSAEAATATTLKLRRAYVDAESDKQLQAAKAALIADLKKRYAGIDCHAPQDKITPHLILFRQLMHEWNPVGCTIEDLKAIAGRPRSETDDSLIYPFDDGMGAPHWRFTGRPTITEVYFREGQ